MFCIVENKNTGNLSVTNTDRALDATRDGFLVHPGAFRTRTAAEDVVFDLLASKHEQQCAEREAAVNCGCEDLTGMGPRPHRRALASPGGPCDTLPRGKETQMAKTSLLGQRETEYKGWIVQAHVSPGVATVKALNGGCEIEQTSKTNSAHGVQKALLVMRSAIDTHPLTISLQAR